MPNRTSASTPQPASILVIEDNMDVADSLTRFLRVAVGHAVRVAYDGLSGVRMATAEVPDAVVCDIAMPRLNGLRVAEVLSKVELRPLLIAVTAYTGQFPESTARAAGFDHYLAKPADPFVIESLIQNRKRPAP
jgi:CheY-like chemotaxis protein